MEGKISFNVAPGVGFICIFDHATITSCHAGLSSAATLWYDANCLKQGAKLKLYKWPCRNAHIQWFNSHAASDVVSSCRGKGKLVLIVWGTKRVEKTLGFVADFCYLCREIREFKVNSVSMVSHVYYLPTGSGKLAGHYRQCTTCACQLNAEPGKYRDFGRKNELNLPRLIQVTYPNIEQHYAQRLQVEEALKSNPGQITGNARSDLIAEPFHLLSHKVEARFKKINR